MYKMYNSSNKYNSLNKKCMVLSTAILDDIINDKSINKLCDDITSAVPSQFSCLSDCGLFSEGLTTIKKSVGSILNNLESFKSQINTHKENIVAEENYLTSCYSNLGNIAIGVGLAARLGVTKPVVPFAVSTQSIMGMPDDEDVHIAFDEEGNMTEMPSENSEDVSVQTTNEGAGSAVSAQSTMGVADDEDVHIAFDEEGNMTGMPPENSEDVSVQSTPSATSKMPDSLSNGGDSSAYLSSQNDAAQTTNEGVGSTVITQSTMGVADDEDVHIAFDEEGNMTEIPPENSEDVSAQTTNEGVGSTVSTQTVASVQSTPSATSKMPDSLSNGGDSSAYLSSQNDAAQTTNEGVGSTVITQSTMGVPDDEDVHIAFDEEGNMTGMPPENSEDVSAQTTNEGVGSAINSNGHGGGGNSFGVVSETSNSVSDGGDSSEYWASQKDTSVQSVDNNINGMSNNNTTPSLNNTVSNVSEPVNDIPINHTPVVENPNVGVQTPPPVNDSYVDSSVVKPAIHDSVQNFVSKDNEINSSFQPNVYPNSVSDSTIKNDIPVYDDVETIKPVESNTDNPINNNPIYSDNHDTLDTNNNSSTTELEHINSNDKTNDSSSNIGGILLGGAALAGSLGAIKFVKDRKKDDDNGN